MRTTKSDFVFQCKHKLRVFSSGFRSVKDVHRGSLLAVAGY